MPRKSSTREPIPSQPLVNDAKRAVLDKALGDILKRYGDGSIMRLGEAHSMTVETIPTGSLSLDIALGVGRNPARSNYRDLRPGIIRQNHHLPAYRR